MQFEDDTAQDLVFLGKVPGELAELRIDKLSLENAESELPPQKNAMESEAGEDDNERATLTSQQSALNAKLNKPQLVYQQKVKALQTWTAHLDRLISAVDVPETQRGLETRIAQIDELPTVIIPRDFVKNGLDRYVVQIRIARSVIESCRGAVQQTMPGRIPIYPGARPQAHVWSSTARRRRRLRGSQAPPWPQIKSRDDALLGTRARRLDQGIRNGVRPGVPQKSRNRARQSDGGRCQVIDLLVEREGLEPSTPAL